MRTIDKIKFVDRYKFDKLTKRRGTRLYEVFPLLNNCYFDIIELHTSDRDNTTVMHAHTEDYWDDPGLIDTIESYSDYRVLGMTVEEDYLTIYIMGEENSYDR